MKENVNYYDLLNVKMDATEEEIKVAYRTQIKKWHPDINKDPSAVEISSKLNEAKNILLDENKRKEYDELLKHPQKEVYENLNKKHTKNDNDEKAYSKNDNETKTYTKWQYFKLYLKYYNVSIIRKIIAVILVFMESFICFILDIINIILAYIIIYTYDVLEELLLATGCILLIIFALRIINGDQEFTILKMIIYLASSIILLCSQVILPLIVRILLQKNPIWISKLNMFLFKKAIGYK